MFEKILFVFKYYGLYGTDWFRLLILRAGKKVL